MDNRKSLSDIHSARDSVYSLFSKALNSAPGEELYELLEANIPALLSIAEESENPEMKAGAVGIKRFFAERRKLYGQALEDYDTDAARRYTSLLCLNDSVPLCESYYTSRERLMMQDSWEEMYLLLKKRKLKKGAEVFEYEDHISVELAFAARLARESAEALEKGDDERYNALIKEQEEFHENRFAKWIHLAGDMAAAHRAEELLFKSMIQYIRRFIEEDRQGLKELYI